MKILFILNTNFLFYHASSTLRWLTRSGHTVKLLFISQKMQFQEKAIQDWLAENRGCTVEQALGREDGWKNILAVTRCLKDYRAYLNPLHPSPLRGREYLLTRLRTLADSAPGRAWIGSPAAARLFNHVERVAPPDPAILRALETDRPDVLVILTNLLNLNEVDYLKAARALGIPTVQAPASWDNLTSKRTIHILPDLFLVWNQPMAQEAVDLHGVPEDLICQTGAPSTDWLYEMQPALGREEFCHKAGLDPDQPFVLYLGSSKSIAGDESGFFSELIASLKQNPDTKDLQVLLRPHPLNTAAWANYWMPGVTVFPRCGELASDAASRQDYYHSMYYSAAVIGVNTTAMIEAAIVDRPCATILTHHYQATRSNLGHFQHLMRADYLETACSLPGVAELLAGILAGRDGKATNRRKFVREFTRPYGLEHASGQRFARAVELAAQHHSAAQIRDALQKM